MRILAIVTARKKSERFPNKNFRKIQGVSLTERAAAQAAVMRDRGILTDVVLSSDSGYLLNRCRKYGILDVGLREEYLSGPTVKSVDVVLHTVEKLRKRGLVYDAVMILQPTSPLRTLADISGAVSMFETGNGSSLITAAPVPDATINGLYVKEKTGFFPVSAGHSSGTRHQDLAPVFLRNGAIFLTGTDWLEHEKTIISDAPMVYEMPFGRSVDIDSFEDFETARRILKGASGKEKHGCTVVRRDRIPSMEEAVRFEEESRRQIVSEDLFRLWLYEMRENRSAEEHLAWSERHVYFDGVAVLADGECLNGVLLQAAAEIGRGKAKKDRLMEEYLQAKIQSLTEDADSCLIRTDLYGSDVRSGPCLP